MTSTRNHSEWLGQFQHCLKMVLERFQLPPEMWLNMQQAVDLWEAQNIHKKEYEKIHPIHEPIAVRDLHPA